MRKRTFLLLACAVACSSALAQDYPKFKPGLWELKRQSAAANSHGMNMVICMDETVQREMWTAGMGTVAGMCSKHDFKITGNHGISDFVCQMGGSTMHSKSVMTINGDSGYRTEIDTTFDPPLNGQTATHTTLEARFTGACKAGQRPGDMLMPNGQTINMRDALGGGRR